jgi:hypothetical protein
MADEILLVLELQEDRFDIVSGTGPTYLRNRLAIIF